MSLSAVPKDVRGMEDSRAKGRVQFFELCFDKAELDVAVQESREQGDSHRSGLYDECCAGADATGCIGTQTWIRRSSGIVLKKFKAVTPQLVVARVKFYGVAHSVIWQKNFTTNFFIKK